MAIITEAKLIKVLQTYNSWWRNPDSIRPLSRPHKRIAYHEAVKIIEHPTIRRFAVLSGARRVGKTTMLYQIIEKLINEGVDNSKQIL
jgi:predicted AAA+ superfamily ATPase